MYVHRVCMLCSYISQKSIANFVHCVHVSLVHYVSYIVVVCTCVCEWVSDGHFQYALLIAADPQIRLSVYLHNHLLYV